MLRPRSESNSKPFARYRRTANGISTARSIKDYLIILSIAETSKGREEDFFEFLLKDDVLSFGSVRAANATTESNGSGLPIERPETSASP